MTSLKPLPPDGIWRFEIATRLIELRAHRRLPITEAARLLGWSPTSLSDYETGRCFMRVKRLAQVAIFYDCSIDFILLGLGWGGVEVANYEELIRSIPPEQPKKPRAPGKKIPVKLAPLAPKPAFKVPRIVKKPKAKPVRKRKGTVTQASQPVAKPRRKKGDRMSYDFDLSK